MTDKYREVTDGKPPPTICDITTNRVHTSAGDRRVAWCAQLVDVYYIPCPDLRFRMRNDMVILETH
jgi:hypothetical protein